MKKCAAKITRIFNPIGFLSPFTVRVKLLFQELWVRGCQLGRKTSIRPDREMGPVVQLHLVAIPRMYRINVKANTETAKLYEYCVASEKAYSIVAYLPGQDKKEEVFTSFVASKSKAAPLTKITSPRLELMMEQDWKTVFSNH